MGFTRGSMCYEKASESGSDSSSSGDFRVYADARIIRVGQFLQEAKLKMKDKVRQCSCWLWRSR